jgi:hypothetical protein
MGDKLNDAFWDDFFAGEPEPLKPDELTVKMVCDKGLSWNAAKRLIARKVEQGELEPVKEKRRMANGRRVDAWRVVNKKKKTS